MQPFNLKPISNELKQNPHLWDKPWLEHHVKKLPRDISCDGQRIEMQTSLLPRKGFWVTAVVSLKNNTLSTEGFGSRILAQNALKVAFAECWERYIFKICVTNPEWKNSTSTNGFAAGTTLRLAAFFAACELFERHCILSVWNHEYPALKIPLHSPWQTLLAVRNGWTFSWFDFGHTILKGIFPFHEDTALTTIACVARHPVHGARFDACTKTTQKEGIESTTISVLRTIQTDAKMQQKEITTEESFQTFWEKGEPISHFLYYKYPKNLCAFDFLDQIAVTSPDTIAARPLYPEFNLEIIPLWIANSMPAVAAAKWAHAKPLYWGKEALSLTPKNPHPHPLA